jgi:hypothetical protein
MIIVTIRYLNESMHQNRIDRYHSAITCSNMNLGAAIELEKTHNLPRLP